MKLTIYIRLFGALDLVLFFWNIISDISASKIPFYDNFMEYLAGDLNFGGRMGHVMYMLTILGTIGILSSVISGVLMLLGKRSGVYISFIQAPLRLLLIMPPTFFFLGKLKTFIIISSWFFAAVILSLEIIKIVFQIIWLRKIKYQHSL